MKPLVFPEARLFAKTPLTTQFTPELYVDIEYLKQYLLQYNLLSINAADFDLDHRVSICRIPGTRATRTFINPEVLYSTSDVITKDEQSIVFPNMTVKLKRSKDVTIRYLDESQKLATRTFMGMEAEAIQKDIDSLNGITIYDRGLIQRTPSSDMYTLENQFEDYYTRLGELLKAAKQSDNVNAQNLSLNDVIGLSRHFKGQICTTTELAKYADTLSELDKIIIHLESDDEDEE